MSYQEYIQAAILTVQLAVTGAARVSSDFFAPYDYTIKHEQYDSHRQNDDTCPVVNIAHAIDDVFVQVIPTSDYLTVLSNQLDQFIMVLVVVVFVACVLNLIVAGLSAINRQLNLLAFLQRFFTVIENEFTAPRTLSIIISLLITTLLLSSWAPLFTLKTPAFIYVLLTSVATLLFMVLLWPISLIYNWGTYFTIYIKGEATMSNLVGQVVMDYFYVVSFFLRINLQFIRLLVLSGVFIVYNEFYFEFIYPNYNYESINFAPRTWDDYAYIGVKFLMTSALRFIYELGHMWVVLIMQANAFVMIIFLILQSLHTVYLAQRMQAYFKSKRAQ